MNRFHQENYHGCQMHSRGTSESFHATVIKRKGQVINSIIDIKTVIVIVLGGLLTQGPKFQYLKASKKISKPLFLAATKWEAREPVMCFCPSEILCVSISPIWKLDPISLPHTFLYLCCDWTLYLCQRPSFISGKSTQHSVLVGSLLLI